jgi:hypothetical protein
MIRAQRLRRTVRRRVRGLPRMSRARTLIRALTRLRPARAVRTALREPAETLSLSESERLAGSARRTPRSLIGVPLRLRVNLPNARR